MLFLFLTISNPETLLKQFSTVLLRSNLNPTCKPCTIYYKAKKATQAQAQMLMTGF